MRTVRFFPYRKGMGPTFTLRLYYLGQADNRMGYSLAMREHRKTTILFEGEDFRCSPLHGQDSDEAVRDLMGFLTLRLEDTDAEYFASYTQAQLDYCGEHAEALSCEVLARFGE
jgi:hypothetical protein